MYSRAPLLLAILLSLSCTDMLVHRSSQDYFPLARQSQWKYLLGTDTTYVEVLGDSSVGGRTATIVAVDFAPTFWHKQPTRIQKFFLRTVNVSGRDYILEQRYRLVYLLPLVEGNTWEEEFSDTIVVLGTDTVFYYHKLAARVSGIDSVPTPAGTFHDCYRVDFTEEVREFDSTAVAYTEWLAPGVGLVKRVTGTEEQVLAEYRIGPAPE